VWAEAYSPIGAHACTILEAANVRHVQGQLLAESLATSDEIKTHLENLARGDLELMLAPMITAWGRKPTSSASIEVPDGMEVDQSSSIESQRPVTGSRFARRATSSNLPSIAGLQPVPEDRICGKCESGPDRYLAQARLAP
jgi:hypothetical protein